MLYEHARYAHRPCLPYVDYTGAILLGDPHYQLKVARNNAKGYLRNPCAGDMLNNLDLSSIA